jgi:hypothetical protein
MVEKSIVERRNDLLIPQAMAAKPGVHLLDAARKSELGVSLPRGSRQLVGPMAVATRHPQGAGKGHARFGHFPGRSREVHAKLQRALKGFEGFGRRAQAGQATPNAG